MKKLLVLVLVLAMAVSANAWVLSYDAGTVTATAESTDLPLNDMYLALMVDSAGVLSSFGSDANAPESAANFSNLPEGSLPSPLETLQGELWVFTDSSEPYTYLAGPWMHATFAFASGPAASTVSLYQWFEVEGTVTFLDDIVIPEPATIALLCLGGLMLRKKK
ncbi:MAG: PEP-CTERM sorting domain-containing protein [Phycisphaerae bacterium]|nr:PEP-CTERM sorting domain-containing protein [Phycisphaerae bacterium]